MRCFFRSYNAFNSVFFLSVCIFAIIKTFIFKENLYEISLVLGILTFLLSIINSIVYVLDKIISSKHEDMVDLFYRSEEEDEEEFIDLNYYSEMTYEQIADDFIKNQFPDYTKNRIVKYRYLSRTIKPQKTARYIFLLIYYFLISLIMAYLFLETELSQYLSGIKIEDFALLSFVIILFEILLRDSVSDALVENQYNKISKVVSEDLLIIEGLENDNNGQA